MKGKDENKNIMRLLTWLSRNKAIDKILLYMTNKQSSYIFKNSLKIKLIILT